MPSQNFTPFSGACKWIQVAEIGSAVSACENPGQTALDVVGSVGMCRIVSVLHDFCMALHGLPRH